jgi:hypothetical protein
VIELEGEAGQVVTQDGANRTLRLTRYTGLAVTPAHGDYYDAVSRGNCFQASLQSAVALGTALTLTAVTFTLFNPAASGKNLVLLETTLAIPVATTAGQVVYAVNDTPGQAAPTGTAVVTGGPKNCLLGSGAASVAQVFSAANLPLAPVARRVLAGIISTTPGGVHHIVDRVDGKMILTPGTMVTIQGITTNATGIIGMMWEEVLA